mmetsp:Transcript_3291/g.5374  ORF Transcript_3291/g.5374 Transcript_3291/m.5374 type:complete len:742 (-) Transcript_3291:102-2327(-)|eukprot:CAMPEP_0119025346 /NCGR_PEP_ID=MMETSP1176-20130426/33554_1 /TAXON_ID=265551 /ORGANISM="Synedropsis recta cf, Strain CCMP1620" /LENGTH=741 /DNA_ID=CAMNT_0006980867 /DNA_START=84 /DNA_END=2309 /DNA_ORIENTATION=-
MARADPRLKKKSRDRSGGPEMFSIEDPPSIAVGTWRQVQKSEEQKKKKSHVTAVFSPTAGSQNRGPHGPDLSPDEDHPTSPPPRATDTKSKHKQRCSDRERKSDKLVDGLVYAPGVHQHSNRKGGGPELFPEEALTTPSPSLRTTGNQYEPKELKGKKRVELVHDDSFQPPSYPAWAISSDDDGLQESSTALPGTLQSSAHRAIPGAYRVNPDGDESTAGARPPSDDQNDGESAAVEPDYGVSPRSVDSRTPSIDDYSLAAVTPRGNDKVAPKRGLGRRGLFAISAVVLIIVAVAVGLGFGRSPGSKSDDEDEDQAMPTDSPSTEPILAPSSSPTVSFRPTISGSQWIQSDQDLYGNQTSDEFGQQISLSGDGSTLAIASTRVGERPAYIKIFRQEDAIQGWIQVGDTLFQNGASSLDLSFDGSRVVIGTAHKPETRVLGVVKSFELNKTTESWTQLGASLVGSTTLFGFAVSISGDGKHIGIVDLTQVSTTDTEGLSQTGGATIYRWTTDEADWTPLGGARMLGFEGERVGSVALNADGSVFAIGATNNYVSSGGAFNHGHVRVFESRADASWVQRGADVEAVPLHGKDFGWVVDLSDDGYVLAVGDRLFGRPGEAENGAVSVFRFDGLSWGLQGDMIEGDSADQLGWALQLSGDGSIVVVGAPQRSFPTDYGYASVYHWVRGSWVRLGQQLEGERGLTGNEQVGYSVGVSADGRIVAVADPLNTEVGESSGSVRIFELG